MKEHMLFQNCYAHKSNICHALHALQCQYHYHDKEAVITMGPCIYFHLNCEIAVILIGDLYINLSTYPTEELVKRVGELYVY